MRETTLPTLNGMLVGTIFDDVGSSLFLSFLFFLFCLSGNDKQLSTCSPCLHACTMTLNSASRPCSPTTKIDHAYLT